MWGNNPLTGSTDCVHDESYLKPSDIWSIVLIITAIIGFLATAFVGAVFIWNTPIVKSSGREHMILRITFSFLITIVFLKTFTSCVWSSKNWLVVLLFTDPLCFVCNVKLIRIAWIFIQGKISPIRPRCIAPKYQILLTFMLVRIQMLLVLIPLSVLISLLVLPLDMKKFCRKWAQPRCPSVCYPVYHLSHCPSGSTDHVLYCSYYCQ